jgi:hypothetical protein
MTRRILLPALLAPLLLYAGDSTRDRATLKGAKSVAVIVDTLPADLPREGVTEDALRARLTARLRDAGIPLDEASKEFVGLRISSIRDTRGPYAVGLNLGFYQPVTLVRDPAMRFAPPTWDADVVLMAAPKMLQRAAMESVDDLADRFIAAWRSVNGTADAK